MDREKLIAQIIAECEKDGEPVTRKEAAEMADLEMKYKKGCRQYISSDKKRNNTHRASRVDAEKVAIISAITHQLPLSAKEVKNIIVANPQREITFTVSENKYSLTLTKHRI